MSIRACFHKHFQKRNFGQLTAFSPPPRTGVLSEILKGGGEFKKISPRTAVPGKFFPIENFFHTSCCLCAYFFIGYALWSYFSPSQRLFLGLGYIRLGAPFWRLTRPSRRSLRRKLTKKFPYGVFWVCALRAPHQTLASVLWGEFAVSR